MINCFHVFLKVIEEFKYAVLPHLDELEKGVIHGDINEINVLVVPKAGGRLVNLFKV